MPGEQPLLLQPHGCAIVVDHGLTQVLQISANAEEIIGVSADQAIGSALTDVIGEDGYARLLEQREASYETLIGEAVSYVAEINGVPRELHLETRPCGSRLLLEIMPLSRDGDRRLLSAVNRWLRRINRIQHPDTLVSVLLFAIQDFIGFDQVMICGFDLQGRGAIIAEHNKGNMERLEGMRFPSDGFPPHLMDQFHKVAIRWIQDSEANPTRLMPETDPETGDQPDLSYSLLRPLPEEQAAHLQTINARSLLSIPIHGQDSLWGLIIAHASVPRHLSPTLQDALLSIVRMASQRLLLLKTRLEHEFRQRVQGSRELLNAKLNTPPSTASLLLDHGQEWCELFRASGLALVLPGDILQFGDTPPVKSLHALNDRLGNCASRHEIRFTDHAPKDPAYADIALNGFPGLFAAPMPLGNKGCGWLMLFRSNQITTHAWAGKPETARKPRRPDQLEMAELHERWCEEIAGTCEPWEDIEQAALMELAEDLSMVAAAQRIQALNAKLRENQTALREANKKLAFRAHYDALTGAWNRYRLENKLNEEIAAAERYDRPLSVLLFDIDHFKHFNDTYGHEAGDQVLQAVARDIQLTLRPTDYLGRWGGEEFVVVAGNTGKDDARCLGERLCGIVRDIRLEGLTPVTISIGITAWQSGDNLKRLLARADEAMYDAKEAGRDQLRQR